MPSIALPSAVGPVAATAPLLPIGGGSDQSVAIRMSLDLQADSGTNGGFTAGNFADALKHHMSGAAPEDGRVAEDKPKTNTNEDEQVSTSDNQAGAIPILPNDLNMALARLQASSAAAPANPETLTRNTQGASPVSRVAVPGSDALAVEERPPASVDAATRLNAAMPENIAAEGKTLGHQGQALPVASQPLSDPVQASPSLRPQQFTATQTRPASAMFGNEITPPNSTAAATGTQATMVAAASLDAPSVSTNPVTPQSRQATTAQGRIPSDIASSSVSALNSTTAAVASPPESGTVQFATTAEMSGAASTRAPASLAGSTAQVIVTSETPTSAGTSAVPTAQTAPATPELAAIQSSLSATANAPLQGAAVAQDRPLAPASTLARRPTTVPLDASATSTATEVHEPFLTTLSTPVAAPSASDQTRADTLFSTPSLTTESGQVVADGSQTTFAAVANLPLSQGVAARQDGPVTPVTVHTPFGAPAWSEEIGKNLVWQAGQEQHKAELVLTPPHLGRIEISITIKNDEANASFVSANPAVRDALEQAMPRLREMLANSGITLGQANVGSDSSASGDNYEGNSGYSGRRGGGNLDLGAVTSPPIASRQSNGLVDTFA